MSYSITRTPYVIRAREALSCTRLHLTLISLVTVAIQARQYESSICTESCLADAVTEGSSLLQQIKNVSPPQQVDNHVAQTQHLAKTQTLTKYTSTSQYKGTPPPDVTPVWKVANMESLPYVAHRKSGHFEPFVLENQEESKDGQSGEAPPPKDGDFEFSSQGLQRTKRSLPDADGADKKAWGDHHSIFMLPSWKLDRAAFWAILTGLLAFIIAVHLCTRALTRCSKYDKTESKFLECIYSQLMMFGVVGLGVFIISNLISDFPDEYFQLFEFVLILCGFGAVGVIFMALILWVLRRIMERRWAVLERSKDEIPRTGDGRILTDQKSMRQFEWSLMSRKFRRHQQLPSAFSYLKYLRECLAQNVCELMDLNVWSWVLLLILSLFALGVCFFQLHGLCALHHKLLGTTANEIAFIFIVWGTFVLFALVQVEVDNARAHLRSELGIKKDQAHLEKSLSSVLDTGSNISNIRPVDVPNHPKGRSWAWKIKQILQFLSLGTAFEAAFYVMHVRFNLTRQRLSWWWHVAIVLPMFLNFIFMLPMIMSRFTMVEAYFSPDHDAIDKVVHSTRCHYEDMRFLHYLWSYKGKPPLALHSGKEVNQEEFGAILRQNGIQISKERLVRIFSSFDLRDFGVIDLTRVTDTLSTMKTNLQNSSTATDADARL